ncbi:MAG: hypothetical protein RBR12_05120 [Sulfurospirillum cavolei]|nr:hypothetical protein [Sulfurospirillum cavolei]
MGRHIGTGYEGGSSNPPLPCMLLKEELTMPLYLLSADNFETEATYECVYLQEAYGFSWEANNVHWIKRDVVEKNTVLRLEMSVFEEFSVLFNAFDFYDEYGITDFTGESAQRLSALFLEEKNRVMSYSDEAFQKRFAFLFELIHDEDFKLSYPHEQEIALIRQDIMTIIDTFIHYLEKAVIENKSFTIVGI